MFIKGLILNGWNWDIPQLSAPYGMSAAAFPLMTSFDWMIMKGLSLFTSEPGLVLNIFWLLTMVFSAWSTAVALGILGVHRAVSLVAGVLYAFLPYALLRNVAHLNLVYYLVPFLSLLAIHIASGLRAANGPWVSCVMYAACLAQGFNYIYYSFFSVLLFGFAAAYAYVNSRSREAVKVAAVAIGLIIVATAINLAPSFYSWHKYGKPPEMGYKHPAEAEIFGAKIRRMIAPHKDNPVPIIGKWGKDDISAGYPNENENVTARLGLAGTAGFLLLLLISLRLVRSEKVAGGKENTMDSLAALTLFTLLVITVGGFSAIFNLAVAPDIRAYNRFTVFVSFFALAALGLVLEKYRRTLYRVNWKFLVPVFFVVCFSLYDQLLDRAGLLSSQDSDMASYRSEKMLLDRFARIYPSGVSTLQLPMTGFPPLSMHENMASYDHLRPFLFTDKNMCWSWPSFSKRHRAWQDQISGLEGDALMKAAIYSGFTAIWVDRFGYKDRGAALLSGLQSAGAKLVLSDVRHVIMDLREAAEKIKTTETQEQFNDHVDFWINTITLSWGKGFYGEEKNSQGVIFRWSNKHSNMVFKNFSEQKRSIVFEFDLASESSGKLLASSSNGSRLELNSSTIPTRHQLTFDIDKGSTSMLSFHANFAKVNVPKDARELFFYIANPVVRETETTE
jgi:phosphoglycerol transferase